MDILTTNSGIALHLKAFLPPSRLARRDPGGRGVVRHADQASGETEEQRQSEVEAAAAWLKDSWAGFNATYSILADRGCELLPLLSGLLTFSGLTVNITDRPLFIPFDSRPVQLVIS